MNQPVTRAQHRALGTWVFGSLLFAFFVGVFIFAPEALPEYKQRMLAIASALLAGLFGYFLTGDLGFERLGARATGGFAMAALVLWWWLSPLAPVSLQAGSGLENAEIADSAPDSLGTTAGGDAPVTTGGGVSPEKHRALAKEHGVNESEAPGEVGRAETLLPPTPSRPQHSPIQEQPDAPNTQQAIPHQSLASQPSYQPQHTAATPTATALEMPLTEAPRIDSFSFYDGSTGGWQTNYGRVVLKESLSRNAMSQDGYLYHAAPKDRKTSYYVSPPSFSGDWRGYAYLSFDLLSEGGRYYRNGYGSVGDVCIENREHRACRYIDPSHSGAWEGHRIPLADDGQWHYSKSVKSLRDILSNVTTLRIRAEYGVGDDESAVDNIALVKVP